VTVFSVIPRRWMAQMAIPLGWLWFRIDRSHRNTACNNIKQALGREISSQAIYELAQANFIQLSRVALELPSLLKFNKNNAGDYVVISGHEHLKKAQADGNGTILLTGHLGHWELMALAAAVVLDTPIDVVARPLDYPPLDALLEEIRTQSGNRVISKQNAGELIGKALKENRIVGILLDQNANYMEGVYVPFFGVTACTNKGFAMFALRYNATVLPVFNIRRKNGRYHIMIGQPVPLKRTDNLQKDIVLYTKKFNEVIESYIRKAPDNWLWVHRRWLLKKIPESAKKKVSRLTLTPLPADIWITEK
jgi:KDO2-lipid IV(A) lauroyltransferase